jgi:molybdate transport system regulatory protein
MSPGSFEHLAAPLWLLFAGRDLIMGKAIELLRQIDSKGSLSKAAEAVPMSYKSAWDLIYRINNISAHPVVVTTTGGRHGGGTQLSEYGKSLLVLYSSLERSYEKAFSAFEDVKPDTEHFFKLVKGLCMKTSARNQLAGIVKKVIRGMINSEIVVDIGDNVDIVALITNESCDDLSLVPGKEAIVLVKAPAVILFPGIAPVKCSAENMLAGKVIEVRMGNVNGEVIIELPGGKILTSVITMESGKSLGLREGEPVWAGFSAQQVILALPM